MKRHLDSQYSTNLGARTIITVRDSGTSPAHPNECKCPFILRHSTKHPLDNSDWRSLRDQHKDRFFLRTGIRLSDWTSENCEEAYRVARESYCTRTTLEKLAAFPTIRIFYKYYPHEPTPSHRNLELIKSIIAKLPDGLAGTSLDKFIETGKQLWTEGMISLIEALRIEVPDGWGRPTLLAWPEFMTQLWDLHFGVIGRPYPSDKWLSVDLQLQLIMRMGASQAYATLGHDLYKRVIETYATIREQQTAGGVREMDLNPGSEYDEPTLEATEEEILYVQSTVAFGRTSPRRTRILPDWELSAPLHQSLSLYMASLLDFHASSTAPSSGESDEQDAPLRDSYEQDSDHEYVDWDNWGSEDGQNNRREQGPHIVQDPLDRSSSSEESVAEQNEISLAERNEIAWNNLYSEVNEQSEFSWDELYSEVLLNPPFLLPDDQDADPQQNPDDAAIMESRRNEEREIERLTSFRRFLFSVGLHQSQNRVRQGREFSQRNRFRRFLTPGGRQRSPDVATMEGGATGEGSPQEENLPLPTPLFQYEEDDFPPLISPHH